MTQKNIIILITLSVFLPSTAMELTRMRENRNHFSFLPNSVRRHIIMPLLDKADNYYQAKDILFSVGLVSKKSYEQINCIFFITDAITLLSSQWNKPTQYVSWELGTPGAQLYDRLGRALYALSISKEATQQKIRGFRTLWSQGVDINFQTYFLKETALMRATASSDKQLLSYLLQTGASVYMHTDDKYVRECSVLYDGDELIRLVKAIERKMLKIQETGVNDPPLEQHVFHFEESKKIRDALMIDEYFNTISAPVQYHNISAVKNNLKKVYREILQSEWIIKTILWSANKKR